jgi:5-(carboxyamino)imidazole ribonucleotide synthase
MVKRVGVIGGGQLAWMMATPAKKLGLDLLVQTPSPQDPAVAIAQATVFAPVADAQSTATLAQQAEVITFENEFVDLAALAQLAHQGTCFRPSIQALVPLLDKYEQRCFLRDCHLPTPAFSKLETFTPTTFPVVLKTRRHGYDGQGTFIIKDAASWDATLEKLKGIDLLVEEFVPFQRELAVMAARSLSGEIVVYPVVETQQKNQVCHTVIAPADISDAVQQAVVAIAHTLLESLQVVGIFGVELFLTADDRVLVNEIAPRTHNSGHYTIEACQTSQFEQQLRAVCGLPLGNPALTCAAAVMVNLLGYEQATHDYAEVRSRLSAIPNAFVHWYGKAESRPGRKLGHVTVMLESREIAIKTAQAIEAIWYESAAH